MDNNVRKQQIDTLVLFHNKQHEIIKTTLLEHKKGLQNAIDKANRELVSLDEKLNRYDNERIEKVSALLLERDSL